MKTFPWIKENDSDTLNDSCFYLHIFTPVPYKLMDFLFSKGNVYSSFHYLLLISFFQNFVKFQGYVVIFQQSWYDPGDEAPNARELCKTMIILPIPLEQTKLQVETLAEYINEFHKTNI